jgi:hypothetical protein
MTRVFRSKNPADTLLRLTDDDGRGLNQFLLGIADQSHGMDYSSGVNSQDFVELVPKDEETVVEDIGLLTLPDVTVTPYYYRAGLEQAQVQVWLDDLAAGAASVETLRARAASYLALANQVEADEKAKIASKVKALGKANTAVLDEVHAGEYRAQAGQRLARAGYKIVKVND